MTLTRVRVHGRPALQTLRLHLDSELKQRESYLNRLSVESLERSNDSPVLHLLRR